LFLDSFDATVDAYRRQLQALARHAPLELPNLNLDTGEVTRAGNYLPTDATYEQLLDSLSDNYFAAVTPDLRRQLLAFYGPPPPPHPVKDRQWRELLNELAELQDAAPDKLGAAPTLAASSKE